MNDKAILEDGETLKYVPDCYKNQEMCNKAVDNYSYALEFVPECFMTQKMSDKAVNTSPSTIKFVPKCFMISMIVEVIGTNFRLFFFFYKKIL